MSNKTQWGDGPWQHEPDHKEWRDPKTGYPCIAHRQPSLGHWCGYVAVSPGHPLHGKNDSDIDVSVHGGLTYAKACSGDVCHVPLPGEPDNVWWLGFDCAHCSDLVPSTAALEPRASSLHETYRTLEFVEAQCADLAAQLAAIS